jgi:hypothetical protein
MGKRSKKRKANKVPLRYWLRYGVKASVVIVRIVLIWLDLGV